MAELKRLPLKSTQIELVRAFNNAQDVISEHKTETTNGFIEINDKLDTVQKALGLIDNNGKSKKPVGLMSQSEVMLKVGSTIGALLALWKFIGFSAPFIWTYLKALNAFVIK